MCCIHGIYILAPDADVSANINLIFHPVKRIASVRKFKKNLR